MITKSSFFGIECLMRSVIYSFLVVFVMLALLTMNDRAKVGSPTTSRSNQSFNDKKKIAAAFYNLPMRFEANQGQVDSPVDFLSHGKGYELYLSAAEAVLALANPQGNKNPERYDAKSNKVVQKEMNNAASSVLKMKLADSNPAPKVVGLMELSGKSNYFVGNDPSKWRTNVPNYQKVKYCDVYPGVDLAYYGKQDKLEFDFIVAPGADPQKIKLSFQGVDLAKVNAQGDLQLKTANGEICFQKPLVYQEVDDVRQELRGEYVLKGKHQVGFQVADYNASIPLIIDPVLIYSTYLGGSGSYGYSDAGSDIALDAAGNAYVTGSTYSADFPTVNPFQGTLADSILVEGYYRDLKVQLPDAFVIKLNPAGTALVYSTFLGGKGSDGGYAIAVDASGNAYVTGSTASVDFPTTPGAFQTTFHKQPSVDSRSQPADVFVTKLNPTGSALVYSTYLGGSGIDLLFYDDKFNGFLNNSGEDAGHDIAVDATGNAYIVGRTSSPDFPLTPGAFQTVLHPPCDAFVTKLNTSGSALVFSTYLGGRAQIEVTPPWLKFSQGPKGQTKDLQVTIRNTGTFTVRVDSVAGSNYGNVPKVIDPPAFPLNLGAGEALILTVRYTLGSVPGYYWFLSIRCTFPHGKFNSSPYRHVLNYIIVHGNGFPDPPGALPETISDDLWDSAIGIALDQSGNVYVSGYTDSPTFPTLNAFQSNQHGLRDAFVAKFDPIGKLVVSTYMGGSETDSGGDIAVDAAGNAYVTGSTSSVDFPTTPGAFQTTLVSGGGYYADAFYKANDAFVTKFNPNISALIYSTYLGGSGDDYVSGIAVDAAGNAYVTGSTTSIDFPTLNAFQPDKVVGECGNVTWGSSIPCPDAFVTNLESGGSRLLYSTYLGGSSVEETNQEYGSGIAVDHSGNAYVTGTTNSSNFPTTPNAFDIINSPDHTAAFIVKLPPPAQPMQEVGIWQEITVKPTSGGKFSSSINTNMVTFDGHQAKVIKASADSLIVRVPEDLVGPRNTLTWPDTTAREIDLIAKVVKAPGDSSEICREQVRFIPPRSLLYDQVTRANPPILQDIIQQRGPGGRRAFRFIGRPTDGTAAVRLLNTSRGSAPLTLLVKVMSPPKPPQYPAGEPFDKSPDPTIGNLLNIGNQNAGIQFPVSQDGWYLVIVEAGMSSYGPFPAFYQIHLAGNTGLPRKLINGVPEPARSIRLDTYFNHPAPREEILLEIPLGAKSFAETGLFKFANPVSISRSPIAVLIPPDGGFTSDNPPVRAAAPAVPGLLPGPVIDPSVPMARTPGAATPVRGTVIDFAQVPIPASVDAPGPPPGVAAILGSRDGSGVSLPFQGIDTLICDMGSGNEIVDGSGKDFRVVGLSGTYAVAVANTPFADTFKPVGSGSGETEFDLTPTGLTTVRYILVSGVSSIDAIESINFFSDRVDPQIGALSDVGYTTITMRRQKSPASNLDPYLELIGPDGSAMGKNDSGFGDDTEQTRSDAALVSISLTQQGFFRFLGRGYDTQPDERSNGTFFARLETAGVFDPVEIAVGSASEELTQAQKKGIMNQGPRQRDSYLFQSEPGKSVNIVVNGVASGQTPALSDPLVELYDPEDMLIAANDNYTGRGKNAAMKVELPDTGQGGGALPNPSTFRIVVCGNDLLGNPTGTNGGQAYARTAASGAYEVKVFTGKMTGDVTLIPTVSAITPDKATPGATGVQVRISGTNFTTGAAVSFNGAGITVRSATMVNANQITAVIDISSNATVGRQSVVVTNKDGLAGTGQDLFEIRAGLGTAHLSWNAPASGGGNAPPNNLILMFNALQKRLPSKTQILKASHQNSRQASPVWTAAQLNTQINIDEIEPNDTPDQAQMLYGDSVIVVKGNIGENDDTDDLFMVTTSRVGLSLRLNGFTSDCYLMLLNYSDMDIVDESDNLGDTVPEEIVQPNLPTGTYLIWVSIDGLEMTDYNLTVLGQFVGGASDQLLSYNIYRSTVANARTSGNKIASVPSINMDYGDPIPYTGQFYYQVTAVYDAGESVPSNEVSQLVTLIGDQTSRETPETFDLLQNYPNPFNQETTIQFTIAAPAEVKLQIFNDLGQMIRELVNCRMEAGYHQVSFNAMDLVSGVYLCRLQAGPSIKTKKIIMLR